MKRIFFLFFIATWFYDASSQHVKLIADERIMLKLENQKLFNNPETKHNGFRFQIFSGVSRNAAYAANSNFMEIFPGVPTYVTFEPPNFKVRVGDFRFKFQALAFRDDMVKQGITGFFIVHDKIIIPRPR
jgi:hypothetical protein